MKTQFGIVDLFSGPGGLGEGFTSIRDSNGKPVFEIETSVEFDRIAYQTLRLRSFLRKFEGGFPKEYYDWINGVIDEPNWEKLWPREWNSACHECRHLELGTPEAKAFLAKRIPEIRDKRGDAIVLIGGPPCQAYSLAGRGRKPDVKGYVPHPKDRHLLYREYIGVLRDLRPAAFVMENVKGLLSSQTKESRIVEEVLKDLREGGGSTPYVVFPIGVDRPEAQFNPRPQDFVVRAERHGVPQTRHRVIIVGLRADLYEAGRLKELPRLEIQNQPATVGHAIFGLPPLRSGLSRRSGTEDTRAAWSSVINAAALRVRRYAGRRLSTETRAKFEVAIEKALKASEGETLLSRTSTECVKFSDSCPPALFHWLYDPKVKTPTKHDTKEHMKSDLERYLFAAAWTEATGTSPKSEDFPAFLAPDHQSWNKGFSDRFRVQASHLPASTITCHISKDGHYFIHPDPGQVRSLTVREAARIQTFPDNYHFVGSKSQAYVQVGNAVPPFLAAQIAAALYESLMAMMTRSDFDTTRAQEPNRVLV